MSDADAKLDSFLAVTAFAGDRGVARRCLAAAGNNVDEAIGLFFSMGAEAFAAPSSSGASAASGAAAYAQSSSPSSSSYHDQIPAGTSEADARAIAAALAEDPEIAGASAGPRSSMRTRSNASGSPVVRAPDAVKRQRLMVGSVFQTQRTGPTEQEKFRSFRAEAQAKRQRRKNKGKQQHRNGYDMAAGRDAVVQDTAKQRRLADMYSLPSDIMFVGSFEQAKQQAARAGRWLMVNIQKRDEFKCHMLCRDVWKNDMAKAVIHESLVFWLSFASDDSGNRFKTLYKIKKFPHVAIIDPITGEQSKVIVSGDTVTARTFIERTTDFVQRHSVLGPVAPESSSSSSSSASGGGGEGDHQLTGRAKAEAEEAAMLAAALAASIEDSEGDVGGDVVESSASSSSSSSAAASAPPAPSTSSHSSSALSAPASSAGTPAMDAYGPVPEEPDAMVAGETTRVQIRMPNGKKNVRKLYLSNTVRELFSAVQELLLSGEGNSAQAPSRFDLKMGFPPKSLATELDQTVQDAGLANQSISVVALKS